jgi:hypothetical protein
LPLFNFALIASITSLLLIFLFINSFLIFLFPH